MTAVAVRRSVVPDEVEPTIAWRSWCLDGVDQLTPISIGTINPYRGEPIWQRREAKHATCLANAHMGITFQIRPANYTPAPQHPAPDPKCMCGYWALKAPPEYPNLVVGTVKLWGQIVCGSDGYRAEYAYPDRLYLIDQREWAREPRWHREGRARLLGEAYGVECSLISYEEYKLLREMEQLNRPEEEEITAETEPEKKHYGMPVKRATPDFDDVYKKLWESDDESQSFLRTGWSSMPGMLQCAVVANALVALLNVSFILLGLY